LNLCRIVFSIVYLFLAVALFSQCEKFLVNDIIISGNNKTKSEIIFREAPFNSDSYISDFEIDEFKSNLQRTGLFNFVFIDTVINRDCSIVIKVQLIERWYYWVYPIFEHADRNFPAFLKNQDWNKINYGISVELKNLSGNNDLLKLKLRFGFKEHFSVAYSSKEFFDNKVFSVKSGTDFFRQKRFEQKIFSNLPVFISSDTDYIKTSLEPYLLLTYRPAFSGQAALGIKYRRLFSPVNVFYNDTTIIFPIISEYLIFRINQSFDNRDNKTYPQKGLLIENSLNLNKALNDKTSTFIEYFGNFQVNYPISQRFYYKTEFAASFLFMQKNQNLSYQNIIEFNRNFWIRGLEVYYFDSFSNLKLQNTVSFLLSRFRIHNIPLFLPESFSKTYSRIYLDGFFDMGYAYGSNYRDINFLQEKLLISVGIGISFETYYDRLLQFYAAYVQNINKTSIFVNYKTPIYKVF